MMRSPLLSLLIRLTILLLAPVNGVLAGEKPLVTITQIVDHPAVDSVRQGIIDRLKEAGFIDGENVNILYENAQGNTATASQIAKNFVAMKPNVMVAITTPSAQTLKKASEGTNLKMVFAAVTDPVATGLVSSLDGPNDNITGVMDTPPFDRQLDLISKILPNKTRMGVVYNSGDAGSASSIKKLYEVAKEKGFTITEASISRSIDISTAVNNLVSRVDFIFVPLDNTVVSAMSTMSNTAQKHKIPVFSADTGSVVNGALASVGFDYYQHGIDAGNKVVEILQGQDIKSIPISVTKKTDIVINSGKAGALEISISADVASQAKYIGR